MRKTTLKFEDVKEGDILEPRFSTGRRYLVERKDNKTKTLHVLHIGSKTKGKLKNTIGSYKIEWT